MFQFFKTHFSTKITNFTKFAILEPKFTQNFHSKASNLAKIQFFMPYFFQTFSSLSPIYPKNQFFKPLFLVPTCSLSPHLRPFRLHTYTKMKVEYTSPGKHHCQYFPNSHKWAYFKNISHIDSVFLVKSKQYLGGWRQSCQFYQIHNTGVLWK